MIDAWCGYIRKNCSTRSIEKITSISRLTAKRPSVSFGVPRKEISNGVTTAVKSSASAVTPSHRPTNLDVLGSMRTLASRLRRSSSRFTLFMRLAAALSLSLSVKVVASTVDGIEAFVSSLPESPDADAPAAAAFAGMLSTCTIGVMESVAASSSSTSTTMRGFMVEMVALVLDQPLRRNTLARNSNALDQQSKPCL